MTTDHPLLPGEEPEDSDYTFEEQAEFDGIHLAVEDILRFLQEDLERDGLKDTPKRVVKSWKELYGGYSIDIRDLLTTFDSEGHDEMVLVRDISFFSMCEHHMLPFFGKAHVAYIPDKKIVGLSKLARIVDAFARRLQNQERITKQVSSSLYSVLNPLGAACTIVAEHHCMACRGVRQTESRTVTTSLQGVFKDDPRTRAEYYDMLRLPY